IDYQSYPDRYFVLPFIAIADGIVVGGIVGWIAGKFGSRMTMSGSPWKHALPIALVAALLFKIPQKTYETRSLADQRAAAAYVGLLLHRQKSVYVMSPLHLLAFNRASNFLYYGFFPVRIRAFLTDRVKNEGRLMPLKNGK